jgi:hypothetical protein
LDDDPVGVTHLKGALVPLLLGERHGDGHPFALQPGQFPLQIVDDEREDEATAWSSRWSAGRYPSGRMSAAPAWPRRY